MPVCDDNLNDQNEHEADKANPRVNYHSDVEVTVTATKDGTITFTALGTNGADVTYEAKWGDRADMWASCPSNLSPSKIPGVPGPLPQVNDRGILYLSETFVESKKILHEGPPKWPKNLPAERRYNQLSIRPTHVRVTVEVMVSGTTKEVVLDLLDPSVAEGGQTLVLGDRPLHLRLAEGAFVGLGVPFGPPAQEWPWNELESSVAMVKGIGSDPETLAYAWAVVALSIARIEVDNKNGLVEDRHVKALASLLPDHPSIKAITNPV